MYVDSILKHKGRDVVSVVPTDKIVDVSKLLNRHRIGAVIVREADGPVVGILSERDIVRGVAENGPACLTLEVADLMTRQVVSCRPNDSIDDIMALMTERRVRHLPVMQDGALIGVISIGDVVKRRIAEIESEASSLREYIATG